MSRNLKIFLSGGLPFGISTALFSSYLYGIKVGFVGGLASAVIFGSLVFIILGFLHSRAVKKIAGNISKVSMAVSHARDIELPLPYDQTFALCIDSLSLIGKCRVQDEDLSQGRIIARSPVNWKTWGDTISFDITGLSAEKTSVRISSRPAASTTIVDYGKNLDNIKKIISFLEKTK